MIFPAVFVSKLLPTIGAGELRRFSTFKFQVISNAFFMFVFFPTIIGANKEFPFSPEYYFSSAFLERIRPIVPNTYGNYDKILYALSERYYHKINTRYKPGHNGL